MDKQIQQFEELMDNANFVLLMTRINRLYYFVEYE